MQEHRKKGMYVINDAAAVQQHLFFLLVYIFWWCDKIYV